MPEVALRRLAMCALAAVTVFVIAMSLMACVGNGGANTATDNDAELSLEMMRGMVLQVEAESLISLAALEVQDDDGKIWRFEGRGKVVPGFTPSHLNEHKLFGDPIEVTFYREGDALVIHDIED
ncbi:MAG: hypothetical protein OXI16_11075 [Chloroflexota bacterium]|nr:hypothetical protein [Chloroflexota bacterium]